jgi:hypothetical protein
MSDAIKTYVDRNPRVTTGGPLGGVRRAGTGEVRFASVEADGGALGSGVFSGRPVEIRLELEVREPIAGRELTFAIGIDNRIGSRLLTMLTTWDPDNGLRDSTISNGSVISCTLPSLPLAPGRYLLNLYVARASDVLDHIEDQVELDVLEADFFETGTLPSETQGPFLLRHHWRLASQPSVVQRVQ